MGLLSFYETDNQNVEPEEPGEEQLQFTWDHGSLSAI